MVVEGWFSIGRMEGMPIIWPVMFVMIVVGPADAGGCVTRVCMSLCIFCMCLLAL